MLQEEAAQKRRTLKEDINARDQQRWIRTKGEEGQRSYWKLEGLGQGHLHSPGTNNKHVFWLD